MGEAEIEVLQSTSPDGPIAKFIEKRGEGIKHISLRVDNIKEALAKLKERGLILSMRSPAMAVGVQR